MIPNLRARLKAASEALEAQTDDTPAACLVRECRSPLADYPGLEAATFSQVRRLGLDMPAFDVRRALFLDTETTGLHGAGTVAFLVGLGWIEGDAFVVHQLLMRDYPEEGILLEAVGALLGRFDCVVTFNGKSFDIPLLRDRFAMARLRDRWRELPQLDLLHTARRTWRLRLGRCTLGALEEAVLGIRREGDLPGAEVPERYFQYLKTGDMALLEDVLSHNVQDIRSLGRLLGHLAAVYDAPERQESLLDVLSIGRALERGGEREVARRCYRIASVSALSSQACRLLASSYRRDRDYAGAAETYRGMIRRGEADEATYTALAIVLERYLDGAEEALAVTEKALWRFAGRIDAEALDALERRRKRLHRRIRMRRSSG